MAAEQAGLEPLPAWSLPAAQAAGLAGVVPLEGVSREWAVEGATGAGVRVCVVDSGVEADHPLVGGVARSVAVVVEGDETSVVEDDGGDLCGHGTACAGIIRSIAPDCELTSVRVLGAGFSGSGVALMAGLRWAVQQRFDVVNMSLSTTKRRYAEELRELVDAAYFGRSMIVASAHNMPVESYPWRFASVVSVGSHDESDPLRWYVNPKPPVEFFARGVDLEVAWLGGGTMKSSGNSFATPHISGICALVLSKHPGLTPFQVKSILALSAVNGKAALA
jgi:subtilisin family serine protease